MMSSGGARDLWIAGSLLTGTVASLPLVYLSVDAGAHDREAQVILFSLLSMGLAWGAAFAIERRRPWLTRTMAALGVVLVPALSWRGDLPMWLAGVVAGASLVGLALALRRSDAA